MSKPKKSFIAVQGADITILSHQHGDFISLTDMVRNFAGGGALIEQWLKNKDTVLFLGVWERLHNPDFNSLEIEGIRNEAGLNSYKISAKDWLEKTGAIWHPFGVRFVSARYPGVSRGSTPGYFLSTRWVGELGNPEGCEIVAGGRSNARTTGFRSQYVPHPGGVPELLLVMLTRELPRPNHV